MAKAGRATQTVFGALIAAALVVPGATAHAWSLGERPDVVIVWGYVVTWRIAAIATLICAALVLHVIPVWIVLRRAGFGGWWSLLRYVPVVGLVLLWVFAFIPWPALGEKRG